MQVKRIAMFLFVAVALFIAGRVALAQQDRYTLKALDGVSFSEFKGYEDWQDVAVSRTGGDVKAILGNFPL